jgi:hypothetical protein
MLAARAISDRVAPEASEGQEENKMVRRYRRTSRAQQPFF